MGARTGRQYLEDINRQQREVWIHGQKVTTGVAAHPAFRGVARSLAALYDMQHAPELREQMTYVSPTSGERVGLSFLQPRTPEDLVRRRTMMAHWHRYTGGMMGRTGDYLNSALMAMAGAAGWFAAADPRFGENIRNYYEHVREHDLLLTHTLINPQANRSKSTSEQADPYLPAGVLQETAGGIVVRGARLLATLAPVTDELMVFPSTLLRVKPEEEKYAYAFAVPCDAPGLKFICRESFDYGRTPFDHPLGARFEEMDAVVVFDDVLVPWERVFMLGRPDLCNQLYTDTNAVVHMTHQVLVKNVAKMEFLLGLVCLMVDTIKIGEFQHVHEKVTDIIATYEALRAFLRASEADARVDRWGLCTPDWRPLNAARNWFPRTYPRLVELVEQLGASGLMAIPTAADLDSPIGPAIEKYLQAAGAGGRERIQLFRLAWDVACSAFGRRQALYERFFFGDPVRMAGALYNSYDKEPHMALVRSFLARQS